MTAVTYWVDGNFPGGPDEYPVANIRTAEQVEDYLGINPDVTGLQALNYLGCYPIIFPETQPYNFQLWLGVNLVVYKTDFPVGPTNEADVFWEDPRYRTEEGVTDADYVWWGQAGTYAKAKFEPDDAQTEPKFEILAVLQRIRTILGILRNRRDAFRENNLRRNGESPDTYTTLDADLLTALAADEAEIANQVSLGNGALYVNNIVSPAFGWIRLAMNRDVPNQFLGGDFMKFESHMFSQADFELHFPEENITIVHDHTEGGFSANPVNLQSTTKFVQIRHTATGRIVDELSIEDFDSVDPTLFSDYMELSAEALEGDLEFGYIRYNLNEYLSESGDLDERPVLDALHIMRAALTNSTFTGRTTLTTLDFAGGLVDAADDTAAAAAGVEVGQLYRNGGDVKIRLT